MVTAALCKIKKKNAPPKNKVKSVMRLMHGMRFNT